MIINVIRMENACLLDFFLSAGCCMSIGMSDINVCARISAKGMSVVHYSNYVTAHEQLHLMNNVFVRSVRYETVNDLNDVMNL